MGKEGYEATARVPASGSTTQTGMSDDESDEDPFSTDGYSDADFDSPQYSTDDDDDDDDVFDGDTDEEDA